MKTIKPLCFLIYIAILPILLGFSASPVKNRTYYEQRGEVVWEVPTDEKMIALSFDDGPDDAYTPQILDLLNKYSAKATFFIIGEKVDSHLDIIQREAMEEHEIANHTFSHADLSRMTKEQIKKEIRKAEEMIFLATGQHSKLFRPPGGFYDDKIVSAAKEDGFLVVMWSWHQDTRDWSRPGVSRIVNKVLKNARSGDIVLFHDYVGGKSETVEALKIILPELKKRGYELVTISELLESRYKGKPVQSLKKGR